MLSFFLPSTYTLRGARTQLLTHAYAHIINQYNDKLTPEWRGLTRRHTHTHTNSYATHSYARSYFFVAITLYIYYARSFINKIYIKRFLFLHMRRRLFYFVFLSQRVIRRFWRSAKKNRLETGRSTKLLLYFLVHPVWSLVWLVNERVFSHAAICALLYSHCIRKIGWYWTQKYLNTSREKVFFFFLVCSFCFQKVVILGIWTKFLIITRDIWCKCMRVYHSFIWMRSHMWSLSVNHVPSSFAVILTVWPSNVCAAVYEIIADRTN